VDKGTPRHMRCGFICFHINERDVRQTEGEHA
jgi:hypothetical protein